MFWRSDPTGKTKLASNNDCPRDGAALRGEVVDAKGEKWLLASELKPKGGEKLAKGEKWLLVSEVKQKGDKDWTKAPDGAAMPFEYNDHYYLE